jgi:glycosyltransferase involved in cell wall biosynthesis
MKNVLLISPYFMPANIACVHRVRLMSKGLLSFGWQPTIVTVRPGYYEEPRDRGLARLIPAAVRIERVAALPARISRPFGLGDISLRAQWSFRRRVSELVRELHPEVIFVTVLPGYASLIGAWAKRRYGIPFVLDYQDPWVSKHVLRPKWNKSGIAMRAAGWLEPKVLQHVDGLTAVSAETLDSLRMRQLIPAATPIEIVPIGADRRDHLVARQFGRTFIAPKEGAFQIVYLGTITERMLPVLHAFLRGVSKAQVRSRKEIIVHLVGTNAQASCRDAHDITSIIASAGLQDRVRVHPARIGYLDALRTMQDADLLLMLGSTDSHYTASKIFPYWLSGKPVFGLFHAASTVVDLAEILGGIRVLQYDGDGGPDAHVHEVAVALEKFIAMDRTSAPSRQENAFEPFSARGVAERYATLFDRLIRRGSAL